MNFCSQQEHIESDNQNKCCLLDLLQIYNYNLLFEEFVCNFIGQKIKSGIIIIIDIQN